VVRFDPAIEAWAHMRENTENHFKFTSRTLKIGAVLLVAVPYACYQVAKFGQVGSTISIAF
jgi:hypothetical protein